MAVRKGKTPRVGQKETIKAPGKDPISFKKGGLHESLGVPQGKPIPAAKMAAALRGDKGPTAQKQANFAKNVLGKGSKTAAKGRSGGKGK
jgi:hypothetical protein